MSVTTTADEKINLAKEHISQAYKELLIFLDEDTWGHNDYNEEKIDEVQVIAMELLKIKRKL